MPKSQKRREDSAFKIVQLRNKYLGQEEGYQEGSRYLVISIFDSANVRTRHTLTRWFPKGMNLVCT